MSRAGDGAAAHRRLQRIVRRFQGGEGTSGLARAGLIEAQARYGWYDAATGLPALRARAGLIEALTVRDGCICRPTAFRPPAGGRPH